MSRVVVVVVGLVAVAGCERPGPRPLSVPVEVTRPEPGPVVARPGPVVAARPEPAKVAGLPSGPLRGVVAVSTGHAHACARLEPGGEVACWGENGVGQAGGAIAEPTWVRPRRVEGLPGPIVEVAAGSFHSCALDERGEVWCWGRPDLGMTKRTSTSVLKGEKGEGAGAPLRIVDQDGPLTGVRALGLALAGSEACAVRADEVRCWRSTTGREADGCVVTRVRGWPGLERVEVGPSLLCGLVLGTDGRRRIECAGGDEPPTPARWAAKAPEPVSLSLGTLHLCALDAAGSVACWRIGVEPRWWHKAPTRITGLAGPVQAVSAGGDFACAVGQDGSVGCFLAEPEGLEEETVRTAWAAADRASRVIPGVARARSVSAGLGRDAFGHGFACALLADATLTCWGDDESGQLGGAVSPSPTLATIVAAP